MSNEPTIAISFTPQELQFLTRALREAPITGNPDQLAQLLPLIQTVRQKFQSALLVGPPSPPPEKDVANEKAPLPSEKDAASKDADPSSNE